MNTKNQLKQYREKAGLTQTTVVNYMGLQSSNRLSEWEHGISLPSMENVFKLAYLYSVRPEQLYPSIRKDIRDTIKKSRRKNNTLIPRKKSYQRKSIKREFKTTFESDEEVLNYLLDILIEVAIDFKRRGLEEFFKYTND